LLLGSAAMAQDTQQPAPSDHSSRYDQNTLLMVQQMVSPGAMQGRISPGMSPTKGHVNIDFHMPQGTPSRNTAPIFGVRVIPPMNLSGQDVRTYLDMQLDRLDNKRLRVGDVKVEDGTITAEIVTVDNSLVQRLKVDRHTGTILYEN